jgi:hypothetical protein
VKNGTQLRRTRPHDECLRLEAILPKVDYRGWIHKLKLTSLRRFALVPPNVYVYVYPFNRLTLLVGNRAVKARRLSKNWATTDQDKQQDSFL